ncbi:hypothetical protein BV210_17930 (plasmid) [Halorientalis sp. IM1011]|uniref:hypothetical protein n=1 Tax=Halorientalis sp. IM1011 TaxID=1932360 RepID=UPI00097CD642|nr:hypothetical protein [Halorientalis sp. IM1011]AQL44645.1 hypothetical protein BV210_17930 [Halorientalis sp. IM1011]
MSGEDDTGAAIREAFEQCESCGTFVVALPQHRCRTDAADARPDRSERSARANADDRADGTPVGIFPSSQGNRYAYHDLDGNDRTRCGCEKYTDASDLVETTLGDAKRRGRSPCGSCRHLRRLADDATEE